MRRHPIFDELDAALDGLVDSEPVELSGSWLPASRRTYERAKQLGSGDGPFIDVIDWRRRGHLSSATPLVAVAFLVTSGECSWSKSSPPQAQMEVGLSFHVYADYQHDRATFAARVSDAVLSAPVAWKNAGSNVRACRFGAENGASRNRPAYAGGHLRAVAAAGGGREDGASSSVARARQRRSGAAGEMP